MSSLSQIILITALLAATAGKLAAASPVVISEFMASNSSTLADEDGAFEDWIEVHNAGTATVNLLNWSLTDDSAQLARWRFPATNLAAGARLVVFASGKDRRVPGATFHTNFRLGAGGEYLALVEPDGVTIATEFAPAFPPQITGVSFGLDPGLRRVTLLAPNAPGRLRVPADGALGTNWVLPGYDDSTWRGSTSAVGYAVGALGSIPLPGLASNLVGYWKFDETNGLIAAEATGRSSNGTLTGFPANNSQWVAGRNDGALRFGGSPHFARVANYPKATNALTVSAWVFAEARPTWASIAKNWGGSLAGQFHFGLRDTAGDLDIFVHTSAGDFSARENVPFPTGAWQHVAFTAEAGTLRLFRNGWLVASGPYQGNFLASATAPLGIGVKLNDAGTAADTGAPGYWRGRIDDLAIWNRALATGELAAIHAAASGEFATDLRGLMLGSNATCYLRFPFVVDNPDVVTRWRLKMRYDDGFVAWLNGEEIVRRNAPDTVDWNSSALNALPDLAGAFEEINLSAFEESIVAGTNLLAIQALNAGRDDPDLRIEPVIEALSITDTTNALVYFTTPTPGADNSVGVEVLGPIIADVALTPSVPLDGDDLLVTARVSPAFAAVANVTLRYRVMYSNEVALAMFDDGAHGDGAAGDGVFGAIIPASASTNGQMVRYWIGATDAQGRASRAPIFKDPQNSDEYFGTVVHNPAVNTPLPVFHWFLAAPAAAETDAGTRCSLFYNGEFYDNVFVRIRGGTARGWPKKSYKVEFNEDHEFLLRPGERRVTEFDWNATYTDKAYVRAVLTSEHQAAVGLPTPEIFHIHLRQNTAFYSVALYTENVDRDFLIRTGMDENGALYKGGPGSTMDTVASYEKKPASSAQNKEDLQSFLSGLALTGPALENFVFDNIDVPEVINYMATMAVTQDIDGTDKNHYLHRDTEGSREWRLLPWDLDLTFGPDALNTDLIVYQLQNVAGPACASHPFIGARPYLLHSGKYQRLIEAMVNTPRTRAMILRRTRTLTEQFLTTGWFQNRIEQLYPLLLADVTADRARWGAAAHFPGNTYTLRAALDRIKNEYLAPRPGYLLGTNIAGVGVSNALKQPFNVTIEVAGAEFNPSSGNQAQEFVCLTNSTPFALDLTGWQVTGGINHTFAAGTVIPSNSVLYLSPDVTAFRARTTGPRGGQGLFVQGNYQGQLSARGETLRVLDGFGATVSTHTYPAMPSLAQQFLRVTELMYHPAALAGNTNGAEEFEYIEVTNISTNQSVSLSGVRFVNGIVFDFTQAGGGSLAPGQRVVVVKNGLAFAARYGWGLPLVAGEYAGTLDNGGERIRLIDATGEEILDFEFDNAWYPLTDGHGFSLVVVDERAEPDAWDRRLQWRASGRVNGSPSTDDPPPLIIAPILLSELLSASTAPQTDAIELHNPGGSPVDVSGWFITDDFATARKFVISANTVIPPGGFVVFDETDFNPGGAGFAFSSDNDEAWIFSADTNGHLTGYAHGFSFGPAEPGVSFGRHVNSAGEEHFVAQSFRSFGDANSGPKVGPLVISEIMFHPPDFPDGSDNSQDEFIELANISGTDLPLFDAALPTHRWRLSGGVDFHFPPGITLAADEHILLLNFNPTNSVLLAAFRAKYGVNAAVRVFGPYGGKLGNDTDTVRIEKPAMPRAGSVPYVLVDRVRYRDEAPWPAAADGTGLSLHRINTSQYGDDAGAWGAKTPGAGASGTVVGPSPIIRSQPQNQNVVAYQNVTFSVAADGRGPLRYQWRFNRMNVPGATNSLLLLSGVRPDQAGNYEVIVSNDDGSILSSNAVLTLRYPASILQPPGDAQVRVRPDPAAAPSTNASFSVLAYSTTPLSYQWRFNGANIPGAVNGTLVISNVQTADGGDYSCVITDGVGEIVTSPAKLIPLVSPSITQGILPQSVAAGATVTLSVSATGSPLPFGYEWRRGSGMVASNAVFSGTSFYTFTATNVPFVTNQFRVVVRNLANQGINANSLAAIVTLPDFDQDGLIDAYEQSIGLNTNNAADALEDLDNDGMRNRDEVEAGTDPTDPQSYLRVDLSTLASQVQVRIAAVSNRTYTVQYTDALGLAPWSKLADLVARPTNRVETVPDLAWTPGRFYRLVVPAQP